MLLNLQILRAVAAYLVVFVHLYDLVPNTPLTSLLRDKGYSGVDLFFVISGFIMVHTTTEKPMGPTTFFLNRLKRITPLYYAVTLFVFCVALIIPSLLSSTSPHTIALLKSLLFVPFEKTPGRIYPIYYLGWTLNYEMFFYLIFAASLALAYDWRVHICSAVICVLVLVGSFVTTTDNPVFYFYTQPIMLDFVLGMLIAAFRKPIVNMLGNSKLVPLLILAVGIAGLSFRGSIFPTTPNIFAPPTHTFLNFGIPSSLIVMAAVLLENGKGKSKAMQLLARIGDASYSIYLTHFFVVAAMVGFANYINLGPGPRTALAVVTLFVVAIIGIFVYRFFERPVAAILASRTRVGVPV
jgi:exopolysaccharide production protein ExoZ